MTSTALGILFLTIGAVTVFVSNFFTLRYLKNRLPSGEDPCVLPTELYRKYLESSQHLNASTQGVYEDDDNKVEDEVEKAEKAMSAGEQIFWKWDKLHKIKHWNSKITGVSLALITVSPILIVSSLTQKHILMYAALIIMIVLMLSKKLPSRYSPEEWLEFEDFKTRERNLGLLALQILEHREREEKYETEGSELLDLYLAGDEFYVDDEGRQKFVMREEIKTLHTEKMNASMVEQKTVLILCEHMHAVRTCHMKRRYRQARFNIIFAMSLCIFLEMLLLVFVG